MSDPGGTGSAGDAEVRPPLPSRYEMDESIQIIEDSADRLYLWNYERDRGQLVTLYNKAMASQWNSVTAGAMSFAASSSRTAR